VIVHSHKTISGIKPSILMKSDNSHNRLGAAFLLYKVFNLQISPLIGVSNPDSVNSWTLLISPPFPILRNIPSIRVILPAEDLSVGRLAALVACACDLEKPDVSTIFRGLAKERNNR